MISKHETVMLLDKLESSEREEKIVFSNDDGESDLVEVYTMDYDVWTRMHKPDTITISVVPGDTLNNV